MEVPLEGGGCWDWGGQRHPRPDGGKGGEDQGGRHGDGGEIRSKTPVGKPVKNKLTIKKEDVLCQHMGKRVSLKQKQQFAEMLKAWRRNRGLSQQGAAKALGIPKRTIQNWEVARTMPSNSLVYEAYFKSLPVDIAKRTSMCD